MFVKTIRTVRLRYAFTQIVMVRSHFQSKYCVEILILQWDHSKLSTCKSPHTSSIEGVTWNRWSHSSIYNKNDANNIFSGWCKIGFEIKNEIEGQCQSSPKLTGILTVLRCILGPNLEILSWIGSEWWQGQAQNMAIFMPPPLGAGGIMFSGCPSVRPSVLPSVRPSVRLSEAWNTLFWPVHGSVGPPDQP